MTSRLWRRARPGLKPRRRLQAKPAAASTERFAAWVLDGPLSGGAHCFSAVPAPVWIPHYLTWPWFADHDVFATLALGWEHGQLPYRDLSGNNFPGSIYLFWLLGKLFGWGRTGSFMPSMLGSS